MNTCKQACDASCRPITEMKDMKHDADNIECSRKGSSMADVIHRIRILDATELSINQSINQTSIAPISPVKPGSLARQPNHCSTAISRR